jgi:tetratricopeptide (TPR) repeat protein
LFQGWKEEAIKEITLAVELDPLSPAILKDKGMIHYYCQQYDDAIEHAKKTLELEPNFNSAYRLLSLAYLGKGMIREAISENQRWGDLTGNATEAAIWLGYLNALSGNKSDAMKMLESINPEKFTSGSMFRGIALVYTALEKYDLAFDWLEKAYQVRTESISSLKVDPKVDRLRSDPRFTVLLKKIGLEH